MSLRLVVPPDQEPIELSDAKAQCRVSHDAEDGLIRAYIRAARSRCEAYQLRAWLTQTWELTLDGFPALTLRSPMGAILLPRPPLRSVVSITCVDPDGEERTLVENDDFYVDTASDPGRVYPAWRAGWPAVRRYPGAVRIRYVAGYERPEMVPENWKQALRFEVAHYYQNRSSVEVGTIVAKMHHAAEALLGPERVRPDLFRS